MVLCAEVQLTLGNNKLRTVRDGLGTLDDVLLLGVVDKALQVQNENPGERLEVDLLRGVDVGATRSRPHTRDNLGFVQMPQRIDEGEHLVRLHIQLERLVRLERNAVLLSWRVQDRTEGAAKDARHSRLARLGCADDVCALLLAHLEPVVATIARCTGRNRTINGARRVAVRSGGTGC